MYPSVSLKLVRFAAARDTQISLGRSSRLWTSRSCHRRLVMYFWRRIKFRCVVLNCLHFTLARETAYQCPLLKAKSWLW